MLLSRVADALYWIGRYLERAENTARVIEVAVDVGLGRASTPDGSALERFCTGLGLPVSSSAGHLTALADAAIFDVTNEFSVAASVTAARENARQVREEISSEMWEQVNGLFLRLKQMRDEGLWTGHTHYSSRTIIEGIHLFLGITDTTMSHGEGWQYLRAGRFLERARATAALLDTFLGGDSDRTGMPPPDQAEWVALLRSCSALEAYCRVYTADVHAERVTEFLLLNAEFPRSVRFAATRVESALRSAARYSGRSAGARTERLAGRLRASLDYGQVDEILSEDQHAYFAGIDRQCAQIHTALYQSFVTYPIESELPA